MPKNARTGVKSCAAALALHKNAADERCGKSTALLFLPEYCIIKTVPVPGGVRSNVLPVSRFTFMYIPEEHSAAGAVFIRLNGNVFQNYKRPLSQKHFTTKKGLLH